MTEVEQAIAVFETGLEILETAKTYAGLELTENEMSYMDATKVALKVMKKELVRGFGCAYCVIGRRSPDAEYCSNCGRKLTPRIPELANESEEVNPDSHQYVDNDSTNRRKSVKQKCRNLHSETAEALFTIDAIRSIMRDEGLLVDGDNWSDVLTNLAECIKPTQPDPITGLVPCGCGGRATFHHAYVARADECCVECTKCGARSALRLGEQRARDSWNTAMGFKGGAE